VYPQYTGALRGSFETRFGHDCHRSANVHPMKIVRAPHHDGATTADRSEFSIPPLMTVAEIESSRFGFLDLL